MRRFGKEDLILGDPDCARTDRSRRPADNHQSHGREDTNGRNDEPAPVRHHGMGRTAGHEQRLQSRDRVQRGHDDQQGEQQHAHAMAQIEAEDAGPIVPAMWCNVGLGRAHLVQQSHIRRSELAWPWPEIVEGVGKMQHAQAGEQRRSTISETGHWAMAST